jgi:hypothetical protein
MHCFVYSRVRALEKQTSNHSPEARAKSNKVRLTRTLTVQGRVIKGQAQVTRSRYEEDIHPGNHTTVWGSFWKDGSWGFACCHQTVRNSYCLGRAGREASEQATLQQAANLESKARQMEERAAEGNSLEVMP